MYLEVVVVSTLVLPRQFQPSFGVSYFEIVPLLVAASHEFKLNVVHVASERLGEPLENREHRVFNVDLVDLRTS